MAVNDRPLKNSIIYNEAGIEAGTNANPSTDCSSSDRLADTATKSMLENPFGFSNAIFGANQGGSTTPCVNVWGIFGLAKNFEGVLDALDVRVHDLDRRDRSAPNQVGQLEGAFL
jgi:hypothetical protein